MYQIITYYFLTKMLLFIAISSFLSMIILEICPRGCQVQVPDVAETQILISPHLLSVYL